MIGSKLIESIQTSLLGDNTFEIDVTQITKAKEEADKYIDSLANVDEENKKIAKSVLNKAASEQMANVAMSAGTTAINAQTVAQKALNVARTTGNILLSAGVGLIVGMIGTGIVTWLLNVAQAEKRVAEAAQNAKGHIKELNDNFNSQKAIVDEAIESYDKLAQGVDIVTNQNISLSTEDYEKFLDLNNQLVEIFPELYDGLDENGNAILSLGENGKTAAEGLKEALDELQNLNNYKISQELPDLFAGVQQQLDKARESAQEFETEYAEMQKSLGQMQSLSIQGIEFTDNQFSVSGSINDSGLIEYMSLIEQSYNEFLNSLSDERLVELDPAFNISSNIDDITGEKSLTINIPWDQLLEDEQSEWESIIKENAQEMALIYTDEVNTAFADNARLQKEAELAWKDFLPSLVSTMESKATFQELEELGDNTQDVVKDIVSNLTVDAYDDMGSDPYAWIRSNIIAPLTELSDNDRQKVIQAYDKLLNFDADDIGVNAQEVQEYVDNLINQIATLLGQDPVELKINLGLENVIDQNVVRESQRFTRQLIEQSTGTSSSSTIPEERNLYQNELSKANEKINKLSINTTEETIAWNEALVEALENHKDLEYAIDVYNKKLENTVSESDKLSFGETITELDEMTSKFDQLDESYAKFADGDKDTNVNFEDYAAIQEAFKDVEGIDEYIQRLQEVNGNAAETQQVFDELATALIEQFDLSKNLTEENAELIAEYLELKGVVNANEIVYGQLQAQQMANTLGIQNLTNATIESLDATYSQINGLLGEADASGIATTALYQLISQQTIFSNSSLNTSQKIQELEKLAKAFGITADSAQVATAQANMASEISIAARNGDTESIAAIQDAYLAEIGSYYEDAIEARFGNLSANYTGGTSTQSAIDKAGSKAKDDAEKQFDWIETRLERLKAQREELNELGSSSIVDFFGISQEDLDRAKELFSMSLSPGSQEVNELVDIANRAKMSIGELQQLVQSGASANNRESYLQQVLNKDRELIETNKLAIAAYKAEYDSVKGLVSPEIQAKIESGDINIEEYSGDEAENIEKVQDAYEKYSDSVSNQRDLENQLYEDTRSYYENRINYINAQNTAIENSNNLIQAQMDYMQEAGEIVTASSYEQLIDNLDRQISLMEKRKAEQEAELQALISSDDFDFGEDSEAYYELQDSIADTEAEIIDLETAQEEYNNTLLQMPIDNMDILLNMYQSITTEIENWGATLEASGKKLNQNYYQTLINNGMEIIDQYEEQADLIEDIMDEYDEGSDQWNELYDRLQNVNSEMSSMVQNLYEWNEALLQLPLDSINDYADNLQQIADAMSEVMSEYNTVIDAVVGAIDAEIDAINEEKDAINDAYQDRIDALQDQLDLLDEQNEKKQLQLDLEQAQYELEQLRNQKTIRVKNCPLL